MSDEYIKSVRLSEANQRALLANMETNVRSVEESNRSDDRAVCHLVDIPVQVTHPDGGLARFLICLRNISSGGVSFVHGGFLYPSSQVIVQMPTIWGGFESISGRVINCRLISGQNHEIGIRFDNPADRRRYLTLAGETPLDPDPDSDECNDLTGRLLYVDKKSADAKLVAFHLKDSRIILETAASCDEAIEQIKSSAIDLLMISSEICGDEDLTEIERIRSAGFKGPLVLVTNSMEAKKYEQLGAASAFTVLAKPYSPASLIALLSGCLQDTDTTGDGPIYSVLASTPDAIELVEYYLGYVDEVTGALRSSIEKDEYEGALQSCRTLMETGSGYGFTPVSFAAKTAVTELTASMSINESITEIQRLLGVCKRIESKGAPEPTGSNESAGVESRPEPEQQG